MFDALEAVGIDLTDVFEVLESEGVQKFEQSRSELLDSVIRELNQAKASR